MPSANEPPPGGWKKYDSVPRNKAEEIEFEWLRRMDEHERTTPAPGTPEREALENEFSEFHAKNQELIDARDRLEAEQEKVKYRSAKWEKLSAKMQAITEERQKLIDATKQGKDSVWNRRQKAISEDFVKEPVETPAPAASEPAGTRQIILDAPDMAPPAAPEAGGEYAPRANKKITAAGTGEPVWIVPQFGKPGDYGLGATIHYSLSDAQRQQAENIARAADNAKRLEHVEEKKKAEMAEAYFGDERGARDLMQYADSLEAFFRNMALNNSPMESGRARKTLAVKQNYKDGVFSRAKYIVKAHLDGAQAKYEPLPPPKQSPGYTAHRLIFPAGAFSYITKAEFDWKLWLDAHFQTAATPQPKSKPQSEPQPKTEQAPDRKAVDKFHKDLIQALTDAIWKIHMRTQAKAYLWGIPRAYGRRQVVAADDTTDVPNAENIASFRGVYNKEALWAQIKEKLARYPILPATAQCLLDAQAELARGVTFEKWDGKPTDEEDAFPAHGLKAGVKDWQHAHALGVKQIILDAPAMATPIILGAKEWIGGSLAGAQEDLAAEIVVHAKQHGNRIPGIKALAEVYARKAERAEHNTDSKARFQHISRELRDLAFRLANPQAEQLAQVEATPEAAPTAPTEAPEATEQAAPAQQEDEWIATPRGRHIYKGDMAAETAKENYVAEQILNAPSWPQLVAAQKRFKVSLYGKNSVEAQVARINAEREPWTLLTAHAKVMNVKSGTAQTLLRLANEVFQQTGLPRHPIGKFRGEDGLDWDKVVVPAAAPVEEPPTVAEPTLPVTPERPPDHIGEVTEMITPKEIIKPAPERPQRAARKPRTIAPPKTKRPARPARPARRERPAAAGTLRVAGLSIDIRGLGLSWK